MAEHIVEQIMAALQSALSDLTTTKSEVVRDRVYPVEQGTDYALSIFQGEDSPKDEESQNLAFFDGELEIEIHIHAQVSSDTIISKKLNLIRQEIYIKLIADQSLGLANNAWLLFPVSSSKPEIDIGEQPIAMQIYTWSINYRHSYTDPGA